MTNIVTKLSEVMLHDLQIADEIWIAVALMNIDGLNFIQNNVRIGCRQNYLIGVDLPTHPDVFKILYEQQLKNEVQVKIYTGNEHFHPKVYLLRTGEKFNAFVGSGNCTNGGLSNNIEMATYIDQQAMCEDIQSWYEKLFTQSKPLTFPFLERYELHFKAQSGYKKEMAKMTKSIKNQLNDEIEAIFLERNEFIKTIKAYKAMAEYKEIQMERAEAVERIRTSLDYPNFEHPNIDLFFSYQSLGHLIAISKPKIKREMDKFKTLLHMLCDEKMSVSKRYNLAHKGAYKVDGASSALISKILTIHNPELYYVENIKSNIALKKFGIKIPRGLSIGDKYEITCHVLRSICAETGVNNLTVLDHYLYLEGNKQ